MDLVRKLHPYRSTEVDKAFANQEMHMLQATAIVDHRVPPTAAQRRAPSRPLSSWLFVAGAIGLIGLTIDLVKGPPANALPTSAVHGAAPATMSIDHSVVTNLSDDAGLGAGASVAAYDAPTSGPSMQPAVPAAASPMVEDSLEPGASVAAYGS